LSLIIFVMLSDVKSYKPPKLKHQQTSQPNSTHESPNLGRFMGRVGLDCPTHGHICSSHVLCFQSSANNITAPINLPKRKVTFEKFSEDSVPPIHSS